MPLPLLAIPALLQAGTGIFQALSGNKQAKDADQKAKAALAASPQYQESPYAARMLADTQSRLNATSPAVAAAYRNANQGAANQMGNAQRNAMSGAEAIAAGAMAQNQVNNFGPNLAAAQQAFDAQNRGAYYNALDNSTNERDKVFNDQMRRNLDMRNYYLGQGRSGVQNLQSGLNAGLSGIAALSGMPMSLSGLLNERAQPDYSQYGGLDNVGRAAPSNSYGRNLISPYAPWFT